jgi:hypothetical protein
MAGVLKQSYLRRELNYNLSGKEVYYTNSLILPLKNMLCSKLHCPKLFKKISFRVKSRCRWCAFAFRSKLLGRPVSIDTGHGKLDPDDERVALGRVGSPCPPNRLGRSLCCLLCPVWIGTGLKQPVHD